MREKRKKNKARESGHVSEPRHAKEETVSALDRFQIWMTHKRQVSWERRAHAPTKSLPSPFSFVFVFFLKPFLMVAFWWVPYPPPRDTVTRKKATEAERVTDRERAPPSHPIHLQVLSTTTCFHVRSVNIIASYKIPNFPIHAHNTFLFLPIFP